MTDASPLSPNMPPDAVAGADTGPDSTAVRDRAGSDRPHGELSGESPLALKESRFSLARYLAAELEDRLGNAEAESVIDAAYKRFDGRFALVSSFGADSAVLLHLAAKVSKDIPVLFLDTGKLFGETKRYRDTLVETLGLTAVRSITPDDTDITASDPNGDLWLKDPNHCCFLRKVAPLHRALSGFDAWGTGRKRYQGGKREDLRHFEASDGRVKVNPLAHWTRDDLKAYAAAQNLPAHPLVSEGFLSIGCMPCTDRVANGEDERAGRWRGQSKSECGIHLSLSENARIVDGATAHLS